MFPWDKECDRQNFLPFWAIFCSFTTLTTWKIKNFEKMKKWKKKKNTWRYYHFTNVYQKWQSNDVLFLRYRAQQTEFFVILGCFLCFYLTNNTKKSTFWKKERKKPLEISSFYTSVPKTTIIFYTVPEILPVTGVIFIFPFQAIFCPFRPQTAQKIKIYKKWRKKKKTLEKSSFYTGTKYYDQMMFGSLDMVHNKLTDRRTDGWTNRRTDRWKKWHIEVGAPTKKGLLWMHSYTFQ